MAEKQGDQMDKVNNEVEQNTDGTPEVPVVETPEEVPVVETPELSLQDLLERDLMQGDVSSTLEEQPSAEPDIEVAPTPEGTEPPGEVKPEDTAIPEGFVPAKEQPEPTANAVTMEDIEIAKKDVLAQILDLARADAESKEGEVPNGEPLPEEFNEEEFLDKFSDNPAKAIKEMATNIADKQSKTQFDALLAKLQPLIQQSQIVEQREKVRGYVDKLIKDNPDAKELFPEIAAYIKENQLAPDDERSYMDGYKTSKLNRQNKTIGERDATIKELQNSGKSLDDHMIDEESIAKMLLNPVLKERFQKGYIEELDNGQKPATITSGGGTQLPAQPRTKLNSVKEAGDAFAKSLQ